MALLAVLWYGTICNNLIDGLNRLNFYSTSTPFKVSCYLHGICTHPIRNSTKKSTLKSMFCHPMVIVRNVIDITGVIPITELDQQYYNHLTNGLIVFDTTNWNIQLLKATVTQKVSQRHPELRTLRHMVSEEYWMEYVEQVVVESLQW
jgi:hypothetical protein